MSGCGGREDQWGVKGGGAMIRICDMKKPNLNLKRKYQRPKKKNKQKVAGV